MSKNGGGASHAGVGKLIRSRRMKSEPLHLPELDVDVQVRRPDVTGLIMESGRVPNMMLGQVSHIIGGEVPVDAPNTPENQRQRLTEIADMVNLISAACLVDPVVAEEKAEDELADNEIHLQHLPFNDRLVIFQWATTGGQADAARRFLEERAADLAGLQPGESIRQDPSGAAAAD